MKLSLVFISALYLSSCYTTHGLIKARPSETRSFTKESFDGDYEMMAYSDSVKVSLWTVLRECKTFSPDKIPSPTAVVRLSLQDGNTLAAALVDKGKIIGELRLKYKREGNYISIKRNLQLIPIPLIYYSHDETKVVLSKDQENRLDVKYGTNHFLCLFLWMHRSARIHNPKYIGAGI